jgi:hypothetical protein
MNTIFNPIPAAIRTKALATKPKPKPKHNPYLFDVREDKELIDLLIDATDFGRKVLLPAGAYLIDCTKAVDNCHDELDVSAPIGVIWVLVSPKGHTQYYNFGLSEKIREWAWWVREFLGIEPKKTKTAKKTQTTKRSKR